MKEKAIWTAKIKLEKRHGDINQCQTPEERLRFLEETEPYDVLERMYNCLLNEGMDELLNLLTGQDSGNTVVYSNANARIGVGNSATAAARTQTALIGGSTDFQGMEAGFPTAPAENDATDGRSIKFKSSWGAAEGVFAWAEWSVDNGNTRNKNLNRKAESLGTKAGGTWTLEVEISLS